MLSSANRQFASLTFCFAIYDVKHVVKRARTYTNVPVPCSKPVPCSFESLNLKRCLTVSRLLHINVRIIPLFSDRDSHSKLSLNFFSVCNSETLTCSVITTEQQLAAPSSVYIREVEKRALGEGGLDLRLLSP